MRILVHDFGGYPFPPQLSRELARRGHAVRHVYCASIPTTPLGNFERRENTPPTLEFSPITLKKPLDKFSFFKRWLQENEYGRLAAKEVEQFRPDVVLSANTPLDAQRTLLETCRKRNVRFVFWLQDLIGVASERILSRKIPVVGRLAGSHYLRLEQRLLRQSDRIVLITEDFGPLLQQWGISRKKMHVIRNWAPLDEIPLRPKVNGWSQEMELSDKICLVYTGTLGMKHNPDLLRRLALHFRDDENVRVVVVSQGLGAEWLSRAKADEGLDNLVIAGYQPFERVPDVLATADVLVGLLEPEAGQFSVPSKVLSYLCAGRPLLLAVPPENLAARTVISAQAGLVVPPADVDGFLAAASDLLSNPDRLTEMGRNARAYAEEMFDISRITDDFEHVLLSD